MHKLRVSVSSFIFILPSSATSVSLCRFPRIYLPSFVSPPPSLRLCCIQPLFSPLFAASVRSPPPPLSWQSFCLFLHDLLVSLCVSATRLGPCMRVRCYDNSSNLCILATEMLTLTCCWKGSFTCPRSWCPDGFAAARQPLAVAKVQLAKLGGQ